MLTDLFLWLHQALNIQSGPTNLQFLSPFLRLLLAALLLPVCRLVSFPATVSSWLMTRSPPVFKALCRSQVVVSVCPSCSLMIYSKRVPRIWHWSVEIDCHEWICASLRVCLWMSSQLVCKKHGKLVTFLRTFMKSRPPPQKLRQRGILRERVFGCDLGEHLHNSGHEGELFSQFFIPIFNHAVLNCWQSNSNYPKNG